MASDGCMDGQTEDGAQQSKKYGHPSRVVRPLFPAPGFRRYRVQSFLTAQGGFHFAGSRIDFVVEGDHVRLGDVRSDIAIETPLDRLRTFRDAWPTGSRIHRLCPAPAE